MTICTKSSTKLWKCDVSGYRPRHRISHSFVEDFVQIVSLETDSLKIIARAGQIVTLNIVK